MAFVHGKRRETWKSATDRTNEHLPPWTTPHAKRTNRAVICLFSRVAARGRAPRGCAVREERRATRVARGMVILSSKPSPRPSEGASLASGVFNLLNTTIGGGILGLPYAFRGCGILVGIGYQCLFGAMTLHALRLLLLSLRYAPVRSYEELARSALGVKGWYAYNIAAFSNCYGACVSYLIVVADVVPHLLVEMGGHVDRSTVLLVTAVCIIFPLSSLRSFSALQYASTAAILIYIAFAAALVSLSLQSWTSPPEPPAALVKLDPLAMVRAAGISAFAYQCATSLFPIYQELRDPTELRMTTIAAVAIVITAVIYCVVGVSAYSFFGERLRGDILLNLAELPGLSFQLLRLAFALSVCFTYPTLHFAARRSLDQMLFQSSEGNAPPARLLIETICIVGSTLGIALRVRSGPYRTNRRAPQARWCSAFLPGFVLFESTGRALTHRYDHLSPRAACAQECRVDHRHHRHAGVQHHPLYPTGLDLHFAVAHRGMAAYHECAVLGVFCRRGNVWPHPALCGAIVHHTNRG